MFNAQLGLLGLKLEKKKFNTQLDLLGKKKKRKKDHK